MNGAWEEPAFVLKKFKCEFLFFNAHNLVLLTTDSGILGHFLFILKEGLPIVFMTNLITCDGLWNACNIKNTLCNNMYSSFKQ